MKNNSGVIRNPPPTPKHARQDADDAAKPKQQKGVHADFGDGQIDLHDSAASCPVFTPALARELRQGQT
jgi:hypothetical protein